jgi:hypothetical protein
MFDVIEPGIYMALWALCNCCAAGASEMTVAWSSSRLRRSRALKELPRNQQIDGVLMIDPATRN